MFKKEYITIPNMLSVSRGLFLPVLFVFVHMEMNTAFLIGYILLGLTDYFDGKIARKYNMTSEIGASIDSVADVLYYLASGYFLFALYKSYLIPNIIPFIILLVVVAITFTYSGFKFKKVNLLHTILQKACGLSVFSLLILSHFFDTTIFILIVIIVYIIAFLEELLIFIKYGEVDPNTTSIFKILPKKIEKESK